MRDILPRAFWLALALLPASCATTPSRRTAAQTAGTIAKAPAPETGQPRDLAPVLELVVKDAKIPGMVAVVWHDGKVIAAGAAGVRQHGSDNAVTLEDEFEICSCTKAMTAALAALFIESGNLKWDTTLAEVFGDTVPQMHPAWKEVILRQVLAQNSGLTNHLFIFLDSADPNKGDLTAQRRDYVAKVLALPPDYPPGGKFVYSGTN